MTTPKVRGGPGRGQGRKPLAEDDKTVTVCVRMPSSLSDDLEEIAGKNGKGKWVRDAIRKAKKVRGQIGCAKEPKGET